MEQVPFVESQMSQSALHMFQPITKEQWCKKRFTDKLDTDILVKPVKWCSIMRALLHSTIFREYATPKVTLTVLILLKPT